MHDGVVLQSRSVEILHGFGRQRRTDNRDLVNQSREELIDGRHA